MGPVKGDAGRPTFEKGGGRVHRGIDTLNLGWIW